MSCAATFPQKKVLLSHAGNLDLKKLWCGSKMAERCFLKCNGPSSRHQLIDLGKYNKV